MFAIGTETKGIICFTRVLSASRGVRPCIWAASSIAGIDTYGSNRENVKRYECKC
jgi:hypothetical protein